MTDTIYERLKTLISDFFGTDPNLLTPQSSAADVDGWDSIGHTMLILEIERAFAVNLADQDAARVDNIGALAELIRHSSAS